MSTAYTELNRFVKEKLPEKRYIHSLGVVESVKAASDVYSPISGTVTSVNKNLEDDPGIVSNFPESKGWICKLDNIDLDELQDLMTEDMYAKYLKTLG